MAHSSAEIKEQRACTSLRLVFSELTRPPGDGLIHPRGRVSLLGEPSEMLPMTTDKAMTLQGPRGSRGSASRKHIQHARFPWDVLLRGGGQRYEGQRWSHLHQTDALRKREDSRGGGGGGGDRVRE